MLFLPSRTAGAAFHQQRRHDHLAPVLVRLQRSNGLVEAHVLVDDERQAPPIVGFNDLGSIL